jgi:hypothetical protein
MENYYYPIKITKCYICQKKPNIVDNLDNQFCLKCFNNISNKKNNLHIEHNNMYSYYEFNDNGYAINDVQIINNN